jgi:hypothetical protein
MATVPQELKKIAVVGSITFDARTFTFTVGYRGHCGKADCALLLRPGRRAPVLTSLDRTSGHREYQVQVQIVLRPVTAIA